MNRQPTLRVESMNGHQVVISPNPNEKVIRFNLSACNGYNADFDGKMAGCRQQGN
jgi:DNA-directed RNA polymerase beta' subunit